MRPDLDDALDDCLQQIRRGADLESCVARYPEFAAQLRPLLQTVVTVGRTLAPPPGVEARAAGRQRVRAAAERRRASRWPLLAAVRRALVPNRPEGLAWSRVVALVLVVLVLGAGGAAAASAASLPGDSLYPAKEAGRQFQLALTLDPVARQALAGRLEARQRQEVGRALAGGREASVAFRGVIDAVAPGQWIVSGLPIHLQPDTLVTGQPEPGAVVGVSGRLTGGQLLAAALSVEGHSPPPVPAVTPSSTPSPAPTSTPTTTPSPAPTDTPSATSTPSARPSLTPSLTSSPTPTAGVDPRLTASPSATARPPATGTSTPTPLATSEPSAMPSPEQPPAPRPTNTPGQFWPPTHTPQPTDSPEPTDSPVPTHSPEPTDEPEPSKTPKPSPTVRPSETPRPSSTPRGSSPPHPGETPQPTATPKPTDSCESLASSFQPGFRAALQVQISTLPKEVTHALNPADPS